MKKIIIAGAGGMLGEAFYNEFKNDYNLTCTDIDVNESWLIYNDFKDLESYKELCKVSPDILIHLGAHTDLEFCEANEEEAYKTNTTSVENATLLSTNLIFHLSIFLQLVFLMVKKTVMMTGISLTLCVYMQELNI